MDDELLIECIRKNSVLYDLSHEKYMDTNLKNKIWKEIGQKLNAKGLLCKIRWASIRDTFRKYLKKKVTNSGQTSKITKRYKYANQLNFLIKHLQEIDTKTNVEESDDTQQESEEKLVADEESDSGEDRKPDVRVYAASQYSEEDINEATHQTNSLDDWSASIQRSEKRHVQKEIATSRKSIRKRRVVYSRPTAAAKLINYLTTKDAQPQQPDPVDAFLLGIAPALKSLSPLNFHFAKSEIFSVVQKYELKSLQDQNAKGLSYSFDQQSQSHTSNCQYSSTSNTQIGPAEHTQLQSHF